MSIRTNQIKRNVTPLATGDEWLEANPHRKAENMTGKLASDKNFTRKYRSSNVHLLEGGKANG